MESMANMENMAATKTMQAMSKVDFHTHILPAIDDGSQSEEQSYNMLKLEAHNGVECVVATPHFYPERLSPTEFTKVRQAAYEEMMQYAAKKEITDCPSLKLGAEVLLATETAYLEDLKALAIEGTQYILIEMPYSNWQEWVYESIERIKVVHGLTPVIAHVERYIPLQDDTEQIYRLMCIEGVLGQMNTRSILDHRNKNLCHKLIMNDMVHVLGSDAHRGRHLLESVQAYNKLIQKYGMPKMNKFEQQASAILRNEQIEKQMPGMFKKALFNYYK